MNRRTFEGPMEWEYQNQGPVDISSPFAQISQKSQMGELHTATETFICCANEYSK